MSKEIAQGVIEEITEWLMQPEAYKGIDRQFVLAVRGVNKEGEEGINNNAKCNVFFLMNTIQSLIRCLYDKDSEAVPILLDRVLDEYFQKEIEKSAH